MERRATFRRLTLSSASGITHLRRRLAKAGIDTETLSVFPIIFVDLYYFLNILIKERTYER